MSLILTDSRLDILPHHVLINICQYTSINSLFTLVGVCHALREAALSVLGRDIKSVVICSTTQQSRALAGHTLHAKQACKQGPHLLAPRQMHDLPQPADIMTAHGEPVLVGKHHGMFLTAVLAHMHNLERLDLRWAFKWMDDQGMHVISSSASPLSLRHLNLQNCNQISGQGLQGLCQGLALSHLTSLVLHGCGDIGDGAPLGNLSQLKHLYCYWCTSLKSEGVAPVCGHLETALFRGCDMLDDRVCQAMQFVQDVDLAFTRVTDHGLEILSCLSSLRRIVLAAPNNNIYAHGL